MAADKWQLAALYSLAVSSPAFRGSLASAATPADLQAAIVQQGWASRFPGALVPLLSDQQLAAAQGSPDADEIDLVSAGAAIVEGGTDAWAIDYITTRTVRNCIVPAGTTDPGQSQQAPLL
jgi:hypothetical protein